ncbi:MAG: GtrA family protein [Chloroflexi bacterium]|nr:GtrA family protein [Chloroflexota bacterium]
MAKLSALVATHQIELTRFLKFATVGALGAMVDFSVLNFLILSGGWSKFFANLVSVACAILSNFTWNRVWTYPESRDHALHISFGKFALVNLVGLGINQIVFLATDAFIFDPLFEHPLDYNLAKGSAIFVVLFWNFVANRLWTYRDI